MEEEEQPIQKETIIQDTSAEAHMPDDALIQQRKDKILSYFKKNHNWIIYVILAIIVFISVQIRTRNLPGLRDITTSSWTLGPDLDPFLFLRWAQDIVANGSLTALDTFRYVPLGIETKTDLLLHPYMIAWFHNITSILGITESVTHSAVLYPVFFFAITVIAFFLLTRKIFLDSLGHKKASIIALVSAFFLSVVPSLLPRTIAGIPEKESAAFFFLFMAFYFFLTAWKSHKLRNQIITAILAGISTAAMALIWGGYGYIFLVLSLSLFLAFFIGKINNQKAIIILLWVVSSFAFMVPFSTRYSINSLISSTFTSLSILLLLTILIHILLFKTNLKNKVFRINFLRKIPKHIVSFVTTLILGLIGMSILITPSFLPNTITKVINILVKPATSRLIQTVAENRQPFFTEWAASFGPKVQGIPISFWLFFIGSIYLFYFMLKVLSSKKERMVLTISYIFFLIAIIFSRYASSSTFNGTNTQSLFLYALGFIVLIGTAGYYYFKHHKNNTLNQLSRIDFGLLFVFAYIFFSIISARAAVRLIMMLVPPASIIISYFAVSIFYDLKKVKDKYKILAWAIIALVLLATIFSGYSFYKSINASSSGFVPSIYTQQWQKSMSWVRDNTSQDAVFAHWWDYGYWIQSLGERATVLDGGNIISYWNHMMGRYALTGTDNLEALDFLYSHDTTHFLIDSTDIGKYSAFSLIGSDINYDRASFIPTFFKDNQQTQETKNSVVSIYSGGVALDEDIIYDIDGTRTFLPAGKAGIGAIIIEKDASGKIVNPPQAIIGYQGEQYTLPLRYAFDKELLDFGSGIEAGIFLFPKVEESGGQLSILEEEVLLYLSGRTVNSQLARLYLYKENNPYFKLVHSEDDALVSQIKSQVPGFDDDIVQFQGLRGPIRIWEIDYPSNLQVKEEYLSKAYPEELKIGR
ncbi:hypothetical protein CMI47_15430 [Candidatus Pacearchaeota archaeon]|nr:hypothetical protein [Candidatus Pacearchaeota archaeon]|tara:strand:- start:10857 stop:13628 length:2772 start_codon:yes stop_codon:yes gene_type:complete